MRVGRRNRSPYGLPLGTDDVPRQVFPKRRASCQARFPARRAGYEGARALDVRAPQNRNSVKTRSAPSAPDVTGNSDAPDLEIGLGHQRSVSSLSTSSAFGVRRSSEAVALESCCTQAGLRSWCCSYCWTAAWGSGGRGGQSEYRSVPFAESPGCGTRRDVNRRGCVAGRFGKYQGGGRSSLWLRISIKRLLGFSAPSVSLPVLRSLPSPRG